MRVLIADDSSIIQDHLVALLAERQDIEIVGQTYDTGETIDAIHELHPDVVVLDVRMPGGGGIHVLQEIKKGEFHPVVIMLTNYPYPQYKKRCLEEGAAFFLDKSTEFEKVEELLENLIQQGCNRGMVGAENHELG